MRPSPEGTTLGATSPPAAEGRSFSDAAARRPLLGDALRQAAFLDAPLSLRRRVLVWIVATGIFVLSLVCWYQRSGDVRDVLESAVPTMALIQSKPQCAYPPNVWSAVPPLYPVLASGVMAATGVGAADARATRFAPGSCRVPGSGPTQVPVLPLVVIGAFAWPVLMFGCISLLGALDKSRTRWEALALGLLACLPPLASALVRYLHPEDIYAMAMILAALGAAVRSRWLVAGLLIGIACCFKQFSLLPAVPLLVAAPRRGRLRYAIGASAAAAAILVPLAACMGSRMLAVMRGVDATPTFVGSALVGRLGLHALAVTMVARVLPLAVAGAVALWARSRLGDAVASPGPLVALVAVSLVLRLVFEVSLFGYYFLATVVMLIVLDVALGRIRLETICWVVASGALYPTRFDPLVLVQEAQPVLVQALVVIPALALAAMPLVRLCAASSTRPAMNRRLIEAVPSS